MPHNRTVVDRPVAVSRRYAGPAGAVVALVGFAWIAGGFATFTVPAGISTFVAGVAVLGLAIRISRVEPALPLNRTGRIVWTSWLAAVTGWELWALFAAARGDHPTISSLVSPLLDTHPTRSAAILLWLALGWWLARR
jgi:hypothetical protein